MKLPQALLQATAISLFCSSLWAGETHASDLDGSVILSNAASKDSNAPLAQQTDADNKVRQLVKIKPRESLLVTKTLITAADDFGIFFHEGFQIVSHQFHQYLVGLHQ